MAESADVHGCAVGRGECNRGVLDVGRAGFGAGAAERAGDASYRSLDFEVLATVSLVKECVWKGCSAEEFRYDKWPNVIVATCHAGQTTSMLAV